MIIPNSKIPKGTSSQLVIGLLDETITGSVQPLFEQTTMYSRILLQLLFNYSTDVRRRFSNKSFYECAGTILEAIEYRDYNLLTDAQIDRSRLMGAANICLQALEPILVIETKLAKNLRGYAVKRYRLSFALGCNINVLFGLYNWCNSYARLYNKLLNEIYLKYEKLLIGKANFVARTSKMYVDKEQLHSNLHMAVGRAIDRCDVEKGTLTSMIERTMITYINNPEFSHLYNIAFTVPTNVRRRKAIDGIVIENFSSSIDSSIDEEVYMPDFDGVDKNLASGIKKLKNTALCHLVLNLPIVLNDSEKSLLMGRT